MTYRLGRVRTRLAHQPPVPCHGVDDRRLRDSALGVGPGGAERQVDLEGNPQVERHPHDLE